jgi:predicted nucleic acid-binding protein
MNDVFLDTVGLIAVWDRSDQWHSAAAAAYDALLLQGCRLVTTNLVLFECGNAAARRSYRPRVNVLRRLLMEEGLLVEPTVREYEEAWDAYDLGEAAEAGIVDHVSFQVMRRLAISLSFTNDRHFQAAGFTTLF